LKLCSKEANPGHMRCSEIDEEPPFLESGVLARVFSLLLARTLQAGRVLGMTIAPDRTKRREYPGQAAKQIDPEQPESKYRGPTSEAQRSRDWKEEKRQEL